MDACPDELLRLRLAMEASGEVVFMTNARGTITYVNPEFVRVYGYTPSEIVGRTTPRILKSGLSSDTEYAAFWQMLSNNEVVRREFVNRTKSGSLVQVECSANPIVSDGERVGFLAVQRDITARKATAAALKQSEMRYRALAEAAHDGIFIIDREGRIEYVNAGATEPFGVRSEDAIGKRIHDVFSREIADAMWQRVSTVFATGERHHSEDKFDTDNGEVWMDASLVPLSMNGAAPDAVMGIARDITERKRLERQFLQAQKMEAVGRLAGGISHDFNNLLTAILGYSELLMDELRDQPKLASDIEEIQKAGQRARRLTQQLLAFSRKQVLMPQLLDVNASIDDLHLMLRRVIGEDVTIELERGADLEPVTADPGQFEQVVINLAVNARDAMPKGGKLRLSTANTDLDAAFVRAHDGAVAGRYVALTVRDTGVGMTGDVIAHAFEPFFTTKGVGKGTGLGLSTVYGIVKQSGGYITIDSLPGAGTTVVVYLPASRESAAQAAEPVSESAVVGGSETILLVEDDPAVRDLMARTLASRGYHVLESQDTSDALTIAASYDAPIDLLLSDVVMPGLNGPDLAQHIIPVRPDIKLLYVSGFTSDLSLDLARMSAKMAFLAKPFTADTLGRKVRECLDTVSPLGESRSPWGIVRSPVPLS
jgi:PAS domain S-box-containing protein